MNNSSIYKLKELAVELDKAILDVFVEAESGDVYAMYYLADMYKKGTFVEQSNYEFLSWMEKIVNSEECEQIYCEAQMANCMYESNQPLSNIVLMYPKLYENGYYYGTALYELGKKYRDEYEWEKALECFKKADEIFRIDGTGLEREIEKLKQWQELYGAPSESAETIAEKEIETIFSGYETLFKEKLEIENWNKLSVESRQYLKSACFANEKFETLSEEDKKLADFSGVVILLMKALEAEVKKRFFEKYINYLKNNCGNDQNARAEYFIRNDLLDNHDNRENKKCLFKKNGKLKSTTDQFTLGNVMYALRTTSGKNKVVDKTVVGFCKQQLLDEAKFKAAYGITEDNKYESKIKRWIYDITDDIDDIVSMRNKAAHPGAILRYEENNICWEVVIEIEKLLIRLISVCK